MMDLKEPLWLPAGSVRAILAIGLVAAFVAGLVDESIALLVLGVYFGQRSGKAVP